MNQRAVVSAAAWLSFFGWLLLFAGLFWSLGDINPNSSAAAIAKLRLLVRLALFLGGLSLGASLWASGYSYLSHPRRSFWAAASVVGPIVIFGLFFGYISA